ncbi:MAG: inositol monophosphatase [Alphaproteobacteria bacterium]|nr:inositol monophosphatase [Alphaproteobacteria bacterium]
MPRSALIEVMVKAVMKASKGLRRDFGEVGELQVSKKGTADFVSTADTNAERILYQELSHARPKFGFLMEEAGEVAGQDGEYRWVIDPLDGTMNFLHAVPYFCISVGVEKTLKNGDREIVAGVIYDPIRDEMFTAEKASGAFLNDRRIRVSARKEIEDCLIATINPRPSRDEFPRCSAMFAAATAHAGAIRCGGATALDLAYVAAGRYDAYWGINQKLWDISAGVLLVKEAGGNVTAIGGGKNFLGLGSVVASNGLIHKKVDALLSECA